MRPCYRAVVFLFTFTTLCTAALLPASDQPLLRDKYSGLPVTNDPAHAARQPTSPWHKLSAGTSVYCIPSGAHAAGAAGTNWRTDAEVKNAGSATASYTISLLKRDTNNSSPQTATFSIEPGQSTRFEDIMDSVFSFSGAGALRFTASSGSLLLTSRTYNDQPQGTYGQFVPGYFDHEAFSYGEEARLIHLSHSPDKASGYRTNLGLINVTGDTLLLEVDLYSGGTRLGSLRSVWLQAYELRQIDKVFEQVTSAEVDDGYIVVNASNRGRFLAYASVIDNSSGDPVFIPAARVIAAADLTIPAAAHVSGSAGTNWRTDLAVHNAGSTGAAFTVTLLEKGVNNSAPETRSFTLDSGLTVRYRDVLDSMFSYQGAAALGITVDTGTLLVNSRTYNDQPEGTFGQLVPALSNLNAISDGETGHLIQLSHQPGKAAGYRTNIGFVNLTGSWLQLQLELYDASGTLLGTVPASDTGLRPYSYHQIDKVFEKVTSSPVSNGFALIRASTAGGRFFAYASVVDNRSGDPIYIPALRAATSHGVEKQLEESSYYLRDVAMVSETRGWAVGDPHWDNQKKAYTGTIVTTNDGGLSWSAQDAGVVETLRVVTFVDEQTGWAAGTNGTILHTSDGGATWTRQSISTSDELRDLFFLDHQLGWAVSIETTHYDWLGWADNWIGSVWHTSDGGQTWSKQASPADASILNGITFVDENLGWAAGIRYIGDEYSSPEHRATIYTTSDGGESWQQQYAPDLEIVFTEVAFADADNGWAVGFKSSSGESGGTVFHTNDGGETWIQDDPDYNLWDVQVLDGERVFAVGQMYGAAWGPPVLRTSDGGTSWDLIIQGRNDGEGLYGVALLADRVVAVGDHDLVCWSDDPWGVGGQPHNADLFDQQYINLHYKLEEVFFTDSSHGWAVGRRTYGPAIWGQVILHTSDGGDTWQHQYEQAPPLDGSFSYFRLDTIQMLDRRTGWAAGTSWTYWGDGWEHRYGILHTSDGGQTWQEQGRELAEDLQPEYFDLQMFDDQNGWALETGHYNQAAGSQQIYLARTSDGGQSWSWVATGIEGFLAVGFEIVQGGLYFSDHQHGWAVGGLGNVVHTSDGGTTWQEQQLDCGYPVCYSHLLEVEFLNHREGFIAAEGGYYHTIDGGSYWAPRDLGVGVDFNDLQLTDGRHMWLAGGRGLVFHSQDGGASWFNLERTTAFDLLGMHFIDPATGWLVGEGGVILKVSASGS
jgi:photosystem II stability/assembly factor-like uncharacterized protein